MSKLQSTLLRCGDHLKILGFEVKLAGDGTSLAAVKEEVPGRAHSTVNEVYRKVDSFLVDAELADSVSCAAQSTYSAGSTQARVRVKVS